MNGSSEKSRWHWKKQIFGEDVMPLGISNTSILTKALSYHRRALLYVRGALSYERRAMLYEDQSMREKGRIKK